jgi:hypothetical protein
MKYFEQAFSNIEEDSCDLVKFEQYVRAYILRLIGGLLMIDSSSMRVPLRYLLLLRNFDNCGEYSWGAAVFSYLYKELCKATNYDHKEIGGCTPLIYLWAFVPSRSFVHIPGTPLFTKYVLDVVRHDNSYL